MGRTRRLGPEFTRVEDARFIWTGEHEGPRRFTVLVLNASGPSGAIMGGFIESCWVGGAVRVGYLVDGREKVTLPALQVLFSRDHFVRGVIAGGARRLRSRDFKV